jgi:ADP-ribose pyrophosphatase YjhB (NUDIX family)
MGRKLVTDPTRTHPIPAHVTLAVVLQVRADALQVLLWERAKEPFKGSWSLPGGYLAPEETLEISIRRHLAEKVDVGGVGGVA